MSTNIEENLSMPTVLIAFCSMIDTHWQALHRDDIDTYDFQPYEQFLSCDDTAFELFLGCDYPDAERITQQFKMFGRDAAGGQYALWLRQFDDDLMTCPVVYFDSEGDFYVVADYFGEFMWLMAVAYDQDEYPVLLEPVLSFAREWAAEAEDELKVNGYQTRVFSERAMVKHRDFIEMMEAISETLV